MLLFSIISPWNISFAARDINKIAPTLVQENVIAVEEVKASRTFTVNSIPTAGQYLKIEGWSTIYFSDTSGSTNDQLNIVSWSWQIDLTLGTENTTITISELAAKLRSLTQVYATEHWLLSITSTWNDVVFTTYWDENSETEIPYTDWTNESITSTASIPWVKLAPAVAQIVDFIPTSDGQMDTYRITIAWVNYDYKNNFIYNCKYCWRLNYKTWS